MENQQSLVDQSYIPVRELKESTRDMVQLQRDYHLSDELFWEIFNTRVLLNEQIDVHAYVHDLNRLSVRA